MSDPARLYERAAAPSSPRPASILHMGEGRTFWAGTNSYLASHSGSAPVYLAGLYGKFRLRMQGGDWALCRAAVIPPGLAHELDFHGEPFAALYLEPGAGGVDHLAPLLRGASEADGALIASKGEIPLLRDLYEDRCGEQWAGAELRDLLSVSGRRTNATPIDPRLREIVEFLDAHCDDLTPVAELAKAVGLSGSRFQHLFTVQVGAPFRRYRAWTRLRAAWRAIAGGATITSAAHEAGFFDQAHFSHEFRRTFGSTPSRNLNKAARLSTPIEPAERGDRLSARLAGREA